jgi:hypothetical protein
MRQIQVAVHIAAERAAGNDKQKLLDEVNKIDRLMALALDDV